MTPEELVQLIGSGNRATVESEWMAVFETPDAPLAKLAEYSSVLRELASSGRSEEAATLAWTAIEAVSGLNSPADTLVVAGPFLLAVGDGDELRAQVTELYRTAYGDREGFEGLLTEAGLPGGRPVRRALRTLDVCLAVDKGGYLVSRDDDDAARIEEIDRSTWIFRITSAEGATELGVVHLADRYQPASEKSFQVMRQFARDELLTRLENDPASIVVDICRENNNSIDNDRLQEVLVPDVMADAGWKKWWSRARTALKRNSNVRLEGRSPVTVTYLDQPLQHEDQLLEQFGKLHDPVTQLALVETYVRDCATRGDTPDAEALKSCHQAIVDRAESKRAGNIGNRVVWWLAARRVGDAAGIQDAAAGAVDLMRTTDNLAPLFGAIEDDSLIQTAFETLIEARPDDWPDRLIELWSRLPMARCDWAVEQLVKANRPVEDLRPVMQKSLASPVEFFESVLWLWNGPANAAMLDGIGAVSIFSRVLRALEDCRRSEKIDRETAKKIAQRARTVLSARKYERFAACVAELEQDLACTLRRRIDQLDNLGRAVREDTLRMLDQRFPPAEPKRALAAWEREDIIYVTEPGMARKQTEIEQHVNVKMRDNARAIGAAAEKGDLSENSEYKFALEERDLLRARLALMNAEMAIAKIFHPEDVPTKHIGIGTRVVFRRVDDGELYELTFVGPWDVGADSGKMNYQAPLAQSLMGKHIDDDVEFDHTGACGRYELIELHNGLVDPTVAQ